MSNTLKLIERVRSSTDTGTDYAVAKALGMQQSYLIEIKKGKRFPGQKSQLLMADLLKIDLRDIVALINEDKATSEAERLHWRSLCSEGIRAWIDAASKTIAAGIVTASLISSWGIARTVTENGFSPAIHYATLQRWLRRMRRGLAGPIPRVIATA